MCTESESLDTSPATYTQELLTTTPLDSPQFGLTRQITYFPSIGHVHCRLVKRLYKKYMISLFMIGGRWKSTKT